MSATAAPLAAAPVDVVAAPPAPDCDVPVAQEAGKRLLALDTFSGTGGVSLALKDFVDTLLYVDWTPYCQQVLAERMKDGRLDPAPIHADITSLKLSHGMKPNMIVSSWPCQDVSVMGLKAGISQGTRSGLFYEVMRLLDENPSIEVLFGENVPGILRVGLKNVLEELMARGFNMQWAVKSASSQGAPHQRSRWFMLAVKKNASAETREVLKAIAARAATLPAPPNPWEHKCPHPPVLLRKDKESNPDFDPNWGHRAACMGNAVVPTVVRSVFCELVQAQVNWESLAACLQFASVGPDEIGYPFNDSGLIYEGRFYPLPRARAPDRSGEPVAVLKFKGKDIALQKFPTPRRGICNATGITERGLKDLPTVLVHCNEAKQWLRENTDLDEETIEGGLLHKYCIPNVRYVEYIMGYPEGGDWTRVQGEWRPSKCNPASSRRSAAPPLDPEDHEGEDEPLDLSHDLQEQQVADAEPEAREEDPEGEEEGPEGSGSDSVPAVADSQTSSTRSRGKGGASNAGHKCNVNAMHVFMAREGKGRSVIEVSRMWKALSNEERDEYKVEAARLRAEARAAT